MLHQETIYGATAPAAQYVAAILGDPRARAEADWEHRAGRRSLRAELLDWLCWFADTASYPPEDGPGVAGDIVASQAVRPAVYADVAAFFDDPDVRVREAALAAAGLLLAAPSLAHRIPQIAPAVRRVLAASADSRHRWIARHCLQAWGEDIGELLAEEEERRRAEREAAAVLEDPWADPQASADARRWLAERPEDTADRAWSVRRRADGPTGRRADGLESAHGPGPAGLQDPQQPKAEQPASGARQKPSANARAVAKDEDRARWVFTPFVGLGPVHFGMSPQEVAAALGVGATTSRWQHPLHGEPRHEEDHFPTLGVSAYYAGSRPRLACVAVDARTGPQVTLEGTLLVGQVPSELEQWLLDRGAREGGVLYTHAADPGSQKLGLVLRAQRAGDAVLTRPLFMRHDWVVATWDHVPGTEWSTF
ncbi:hypothetical protein ACFVYP_39220 [Kitasatospora sp. NPDC058201]|uniref:hypothetical protein n=1 Tax=unclassified Kitasatospora TaxID=2633591 RepID=UPI003663EA23